MSRRWVLVGFLVAALFTAGILSGFASARPDGLEYVAAEAGFLETATPHQTEASPLAEYQVDGVDGRRTSIGLAGVAGAIVTLLVMGALTLVLRKRDKPDEG